MAAYRRVLTHVTCKLTAKNRDQLRNPTLGNRVWATFTRANLAFQLTVAFLVLGGHRLRLVYNLT